MFEQIITENPYSFSSPAENGRLFVGREALLRWLTAHLNQAQSSIVLYGTTRIGKTSLLKHLVEQPPLADMLPLYIDLAHFDVDSSSGFLWELAQTAVYQLEQHQLIIPDPIQSDFITAPFQAFRQQVIEPLRENELETPCLFLFDNANELTTQMSSGQLPPAFATKLQETLHALNHSQLVYTLTHHEERPPFAQLEQLGSSVHHMIEPLDNAAVAKLVRQPVGYTVVRDVVDYIHTLTGGHPYDVQLICHALYERRQLHNVNHLTVADVIQTKNGTLRGANFQTAVSTPLPEFALAPPQTKMQTEQRRRPGRRLRSTTAVLAAIFAALSCAILATGSLVARNNPELLTAWLNLPAPTIIVQEVFLEAPTPTPGPPTATPTATATTTPTPTATPTVTPTATPTTTPTPTPTPTLTSSGVVLRDLDGMPMIKIDGATFPMGSAEGEFLTVPDEVPLHEVTLTDYYIDKYEVSVAQYAAFLNENGGHERACENIDCALTRLGAGERSYLVIQDFGDGTIQYSAQPGFANYPINYVSWFGAKAYCEHVGARLPTEAEWEHAARGKDGRLYPWGNDPPTPFLAVYQSESYDNLKAVDALPSGASPFGLLGMAGSMWEWVSDWYAEDYYAQSPRVNPQGPDTGLTRVVRGGAWPFNIANDRIRTNNRNSIDPNFLSSSVGFRCARDG